MGSVFGNGRRALAEEVPVGYKRTEVGVIPELIGPCFPLASFLTIASSTRQFKSRSR